MMSIRLKAKELQSYKVDVAISAHVADADRLRLNGNSPYTAYPYCPKGQMCNAYDNLIHCKKAELVY